MCLREFPWSQRAGPLRPKHFVASTTLERLPCSQRPTISSVRPTVSPVPPSGYTSAVSKNVTPPSAARSMIEIEVFSSHCKPNVMVPRQSRETCRPVRPRRTCFIRSFSRGGMCQEYRTGVPTFAEWRSGGWPSARSPTLYLRPSAVPTQAAAGAANASRTPG